MADALPITKLLSEWSQGSGAALAELAPFVHRELHALARMHLGPNRGRVTLQPTELIHEAYLRLIGKPVAWENRSHFFGIAARLMRLVLVDHARARKSAKRGGGAECITLEESIALAPSKTPNVIEIDEALNRLAAVDERKANVVEMRYFGGMSREEIGEALGLSVATVKRDLRLAEAWLRNALSRAEKADGRT